MNMINEVRAFDYSIELNQLSTGQIALWYALININNRCAWIEWFAVSSTMLQLKTGLSRRGIYDARNVLKQRGYIDFKETGNGKAAKYKLLTLSQFAQDTAQVSLQATAQDTAHLTAQVTAPLNKQDKTKQDNIPPISPKGKKSEIFKSFAGNNTALLLALEDFEKMRIAIKKPMTDRARSMLLTELIKLSDEPKTQVDILGQSILHNWQTVYALKSNKIDTPKNADRWEGINLD